MAVAWLPGEEGAGRTCSGPQAGLPIQRRVAGIMGGDMRKVLVFGLASIGLTVAVLVGSTNRAECAGDDCPPYNSPCQTTMQCNGGARGYKPCAMECDFSAHPDPITGRCR